MKTQPAALIVSAILTLAANACLGAFDATFTGPLYNSDPYTGDILSGGTLRLQSGTGPSIAATFTSGSPSGYFTDNMVLFIDSKPGGFGASTTFVGSGNLGQAAAGYNSSFDKRCPAVFGAPAGQSFGADYIIALGVYNNGAVFSIGSDGTLNQVQSFALSPNDNDRGYNYTFSFSWNSIGVTDPSAGGFRFYSSRVANTGNRVFDSMESITGSPNWGNTITFNDYHVFGVDPVPEPANLALAIFGGLTVTGGVVNSVRRKLSRIQRGG